MELTVTNSRGPGESVPPLFAGPVRDDLIARIRAALTQGNYEESARLLHEADATFPEDSAVAALHLLSLKLAQRKSQFESALTEAFSHLKEDRFSSSLGKFREAISLSKGYEFCERQVYETVVATAGKFTENHWRFASALLSELPPHHLHAAVNDAINLEQRREAVHHLLDECSRADQSGDLPHLRDRLLALLKTYPGEESLTTHLHSLDGMIAERANEERAKNLRRLTLFRDRLDASDHPDTMRRFSELVSPFVSGYQDDPEFTAVIEEVRVLHAKYQKSADLMATGRPNDALQICDEVLQVRPANVLFGALEQKAKSREWVARLVASGAQRAQAFEQKGQYAAAMEEWTAVREMDPKFPGLASEIFHCAALSQTVESLRASVPERPALAAHEFAGESPAEPAPAPSLFTYHELRARSFGGLKIAITEEAWNHLKTGLATSLAVLLVILMLASSARK